MAELLSGKVAVVSGVGPGLGRETALALARSGADVALAARSADVLDKVAADVEALGRRALAVPTDVTDPEACDRLVTATREHFGRLDVLVNNAFHPGDFRLFVEADFDEWRKVMDVNLFGSLQMTRACVPSLAEHGDGRVVMVNTMSVQRVERRYGAYAASKAALATLTKTLAVELGRDGIRVNGVHPGYIDGESVQLLFDLLARRRGVRSDQVRAEVEAETALRHLPTAEEVAGAIVFLASPLANAVTGQSLSVNGGHWLD